MTIGILTLSISNENVKTFEKCFKSNSLTAYRSLSVS